VRQTNYTRVAAAEETNARKERAGGEEEERERRRTKKRKKKNENRHSLRDAAAVQGEAVASSAESAGAAFVSTAVT
jgi:hypothetical protein